MEAEADVIDLRVEHLTEREGITKYEAYGRFLSTAEGMRLLADLKVGAELVRRGVGRERQVVRLEWRPYKLPCEQVRGMLTGM